MDPCQHYRRFKAFVFQVANLYQNPNLLDDAPCKQSYKDYFFHYYHSLLGRQISELKSRHIQWFRKLLPVLTLPPGSSILDFGGGYGMDTLFLASCGYNMVFYEKTPNHIAICRHLKNACEGVIGPLSIKTVLAGDVPNELFGNVDAIVVNEVAHHIEPPSTVFLKAHDLLRESGSLFLVEPNFFNPLVHAYFFRVRGFRTVLKKVDAASGTVIRVGNEHIRPAMSWNAIAKQSGFYLVDATYSCRFGIKEGTSENRIVCRRSLELFPVIRQAVSSHITFQYRKKKR